MFSLNQIKTMFEMQAELNTVMGSPTWLTDDNNYALAAKVEIVEAIDHYGFKWWKKQTPNLPQVKLEIVDAWHFMMSAWIVGNHKAGNDIKNFYSDLEVNFNLAVSDYFKIDSPQFTTINKFDWFLEDLCVKGPEPLLLKSICEDIGLTGDEFFKMYVAKNTLNLFRQKHGDKQGTYIKQWFGQEDNVFLANQIDVLDLAAPDFIDQLNAALEAQYAAVKAAVTH